MLQLLEVPMAIDPDAVLKERTDRIEKSIDELRREMNTNYNHLRSEVIAVETRISNEFSETDASLTKLREIIVGNGSTGLAQKLVSLEMLVHQNAEAVKAINDSSRYWLRWFIATGIAAMLSLGMSGIGEIMQMWAAGK